MRSSGFTLIELLVVVSIMGILSVLAFVNFKDFTQTQQLNKAVGEIQTFLRVAQTNATSSTLCTNRGGSIGGVSWTVRINSDKKSMDIYCGTNSSCSANTCYKTLTLQNVKVDSIKASACDTSTFLTLPVKFTYAALSGAIVFTDSSTDSSGSTSNASCLSTSQTITFKLTNSANFAKSFSISKGGAIDVR